MVVMICRYFVEKSVVFIWEMVVKQIVVIRLFTLGVEKKQMNQSCKKDDSLGCKLTKAKDLQH